SGQAHRAGARRRGVPREPGAEEMTSTLAVDVRDHVALLTLSNPGKRNALDPPLLAALHDALTRLPGEGVRAAVLTGAGDAFSSGYDIGALPDAAAPPTENPLERALTALAEGPLPVVAAL